MKIKYEEVKKQYEERYEGEKDWETYWKDYKEGFYFGAMDVLYEFAREGTIDFQTFLDRMTRLFVEIEEQREEEGYVRKKKEDLPELWDDVEVLEARELQEEEDLEAFR